MTQVGHTLTGIALGAASAPRDATPGRIALHLVCFALLANMPDLPFPGWGHDAYHISHSVFVNLALIGLLLIVVIAAWGRIRKMVEHHVVIAGIVAWLSHLLLDSFYNHGRGVAIFWPFSQARLALPIPWFSAVSGSPLRLDSYTLRACAVEFACYLPLVLLAIGVRQLALRRVSKRTRPARPPSGPGRVGGGC